MIKNLSSKVLIILALLYMHPSWAFGEFNMDGMPDLSAARFNLVCSEIADGKVREENFNQGLCVGIILGVEDNAHYDKKICVPKNISIKERVQVINDYIATQPKRTNETFASLVFDAMIEKWPCKN
jgi:Rap1a immunity proteins